MYGHTFFYFILCLPGSPDSPEYHELIWNREVTEMLLLQLGCVREWPWPPPELRACVWKHKCENWCHSQLCVPTGSTFMWENENYGRDGTDLYLPWYWLVFVNETLSTFLWRSKKLRKHTCRGQGQPWKTLTSLRETVWQPLPFPAFVLIGNVCWYHKYDFLNLN